MRAFSFVFATVAFGFSAQAILFGRPVISDNVHNCLRDINAAANQYDTLDKYTSGFETSKGQEYLSLFHDKEQVLENFIEQGISDCCSSTRIELNEYEVSASVDAITSYATKGTSAFHTIKEIRPKILPVKDAEMHAQIHIRGMTNLTEILFECLISNTPKEYVSTFKGLNQTLSNAFAAAKKTYGI